MKKLFIVTAIYTVLQSSGTAQNTRFGLQAGALMSNYTVKVMDYNLSASSRVGITAGVIADFPLGKNVSIQPAINYVQYGSKAGRENEYDEEEKLRVNALEVPINLLYKSAAGKGKLYIGAGPAISFHTSGKHTVTGPDGTLDESLKFGSEGDSDFKSMFVSLNFTTGYSFANGLNLSLNFNTGLTDIEVGDSDDSSTKGHYFGLRVGYFFKSK